VTGVYEYVHESSTFIKVGNNNNRDKEKNNRKMYLFLIIPVIIVPCSELYLTKRNIFYQYLQPAH
jgi:hypothetical protein